MTDEVVKFLDKYGDKNRCFVILFNTVFSVWLSWQLAPDYNLINNLLNR